MKKSGRVKIKLYTCITYEGPYENEDNDDT